MAQPSSAIKYPITTWLALVVILLLPIYYVRFRLFGLPTNALEILVLLTFASLFLYRPDIKTNPLNIFLPGIGLLLLGLLIGVAVSVDKEKALGVVKGWFLIPMLYGWVVAQISDKKSVPLFVLALFINILGVSLYTLLQYFGIVPLLPHQAQSSYLFNYLEQDRALAFFESPNYVAMYLTPPLIFLAIYYYRQKANLFALLFPFVAIYLSGSRAAVITFVLLITLALARPLLKRGVTYLLLGSVAIVVLLWVYLTNNINFGGVDTLRLAIWQVAVDLIKQHPLTGIGPQQFMHYFENSTLLAAAPYEGALPYALHPHNLYLNLWLSGGILAIAGFVFIVTRVIKVLKHHGNGLITQASVWALLAILVHGLLDSTYFKNDLSVIAWFFLSLLAYLALHGPVSKSQT